MKRIDHTGQRFGKLFVLCAAETVNGHARWKCRCDCGNEVVVDAGNLRSGHTQSCGHCEKYSFINADTMRCDLPTGDYFLFDAKDYPVVSQHKWSINEQGYVHTTFKGKHIKFHSFLLETRGVIVDHVNGDKYDNRRSNLRLCSAMENSRNQRLRINSSTGFKGVSFDSRRKKYIASITVNYKTKFLGYYSNPIDAALKYDQTALLIFGEYARPNFKEVSASEKILELDQKRGYGAA